VANDDWSQRRADEERYALEKSIWLKNEVCVCEVCPRRRERELAERTAMQVHSNWMLTMRRILGHLVEAIKKVEEEKTKTP
jgi:hypothetical protein